MNAIESMLGLEETRSIDSILNDLMQVPRKYGQHHVKVDFSVSDCSMPARWDRDVVTGKLVPKYVDGVGLVLSPNGPVHYPGVYALSMNKTHTVYVGANNGPDSKGSIYSRVTRFGKAIYDRLADNENHAAGTKYRQIYGEDTSSLYLSYMLYEQIPDSLLRDMKSARLLMSDLERLIIHKFRSKYLLNHKIK